jgi:hypothetical protein
VSEFLFRRWICRYLPLAEIGIDPDRVRGTITFYELPISSLMGMPGAGVERLGTLWSKQLDSFGLPEETWREAT